MSIFLMARFFRADMGQANRKLMAVRLADFADDDGCGVYPGVARLAAETHLSERTVQRILADFEAEGLLVCRERATGKRGMANRYDFDLSVIARIEAGTHVRTATGDTLSPHEDAATGDTGAARGDNDDAMGCQGDTLTVIEPPLEPLLEKNADERETGQDDGQAASGEATDIKAIVRAYWRMIRIWPNVDGLPKDGWLGAWKALSDAERAEAERKFPDWLKLLEAGGKGGRHTPRPSTYFAKKLWLDVADKPAVEPKQDIAAPFGKAWMACRMAELFKPERPHPPAPVTVSQMIAGGGERADDEIIKRRWLYSWPRLAAMDAAYDDYKPFRVPQGFAEMGADFVSTKLDGPVGLAWARLFRRMKLPWLPKGRDYAHLPPIAAGATDLDAAVAAAFWDFKRKIEGDVHAAAE